MTNIDRELMDNVFDKTTQWCLQQKTTAPGLHEASPPCNFSWIAENRLAAMAWPKSKENLNFLWQQGIRHLVTLSPEKTPPIVDSKLEWTLLEIEEFEAPALSDIIKFIGICKECMSKNQGVGVHCRMGQGRTGVMAACFLVHFEDMVPQSAIVKVRHQRPWSLETYSQERAVHVYYDYLRGTRMK